MRLNAMYVLCCENILQRNATSVKRKILTGKSWYTVDSFQIRQFQIMEKITGVCHYFSTQPLLFECQSHF